MAFRDERRLSRRSNLVLPILRNETRSAKRMNRRSFLQSILAAGVAQAISLPAFCADKFSGIETFVLPPKTNDKTDCCVSRGYYGVKGYYDGIQYGAIWTFSKTYKEAQEWEAMTPDQQHLLLCHLERVGERKFRAMNFPIVTPDARRS